MIDKLVKYYLTDLSFYHSKPVKDGHKEDDSNSSQDESGPNRYDTFDDDKLNPKHKRI